MDAERLLSHEIKAGTIWVNCYSQIDPSIGFGVIKMNGYGSKVARSMWKSSCTKRLSTSTSVELGGAGNRRPTVRKSGLKIQVNG